MHIINKGQFNKLNWVEQTYRYSKFNPDIELAEGNKNICLGFLLE
jgi:hypothetical protein